MFDQSTLTDQSRFHHPHHHPWPPPRPPRPQQQVQGHFLQFQDPKRRSVFKPKKYHGRARRQGYRPTKAAHRNTAPHTPHNTTSFLIRAKESGGFASTVSPYPVTPTTLPTPVLSPIKESLGDAAREEWGVDGYGSMNGLIRFRGEPENPDDVDDCSLTCDDVEKRLNHDVSRFEMVHNYDGNDLNSLRDEEEEVIERLEEENLALRDKVCVMEKELEDLRSRVRCLESEMELCGDNM